MKTKFLAVVATQRSGTTLFRDILSSHNNVLALPEIFLEREKEKYTNYFFYLKNHINKSPEMCLPSREQQDKNFINYLSYLVSQSNNKKLISFDCKYNFFLGMFTPNYVNFSERPILFQLFQKYDVKVIHIIRENILATLVSSLLSMKNKLWATDNLDKVKHLTVHVDTSRLVEQLTNRQREVDYFRTLFSGIPWTLEISYEHLTNNGNINGTLLESVSNFLEIKDSFTREPSLKKIAPPLRECIENLKEVETVLLNTEFHKMLDY